MLCGHLETDLHAHNQSNGKSKQLVIFCTRPDVKDDSIHNIVIMLLSQTYHATHGDADKMEFLAAQVVQQRNCIFGKRTNIVRQPWPEQGM